MQIKSLSTSGSGEFEIGGITITIGGTGATADPDAIVEIGPSRQIRVKIIRHKKLGWMKVIAWRSEKRFKEMHKSKDMLRGAGIMCSKEHEEMLLKQLGKSWETIFEGILGEKKRRGRKRKRVAKKVKKR